MARDKATVKMSSLEYGGHGPNTRKVVVMGAWDARFKGISLMHTSYVQVVQTSGCPVFKASLVVPVVHQFPAQRINIGPTSPDSSGDVLFFSFL